MKRTRRFLCFLLAAALLISLCAGCGQAQDSAFTVDGALTMLSSETYGGRVVGSLGNQVAGDYLSDLFRQLKLEPFLRDDYFQVYEQMCGFPEEAHPQISLGLADGSTSSLTAGKDYVYSLPRQDIDGTFPVSTDQAACTDGQAVFFASASTEASSFILNGDDLMAVTCDDDLSSVSCGAKLRYPTCGTLITLSEQYRQALTSGGTQLKLSINRSARKAEARNIAACLPGTEGKQAFLISAHYDGTGMQGDMLCPSAFDNASGVVTVLETARLLSKRDKPLKNDVIFVLFNGEEAGLYGSQAFAKALSGKYERYDMINIDCVGLHPDRMTAYTDVDNLNAALLDATLAAMGGGCLTGSDYPGDHYSFEELDEASCVTLSDAIILTEDDGCHTMGDTPERLDPDILRQTAKSVAALVAADQIYAKQAGKKETIDNYAGLSVDQLDQLRQLIEDGVLTKATQAYIIESAAASSTALTGSLKLLLSPEEVAAAVPGLVLPQTIGDYTFSFSDVKFNCQGSAFSLYTSLHGECAQDTIYDFAGQLTPATVSALYVNAAGHTAQLLISPDWVTTDGTVPGETLDESLTGWTLSYMKNDAYSIDGYCHAFYLDPRGLGVHCFFGNKADVELPDNGWDLTGVVNLLGAGVHPRYVPAAELPGLLPLLNQAKALAPMVDAPQPAP